MVSDKTFASFVADLEPASVPRRFITAVIYSIEESEECFYMRADKDIDDFLAQHPRFDGLVARGVAIAYDKLRHEVEREFDYIMGAARRKL